MKLAVSATGNTLDAVVDPRFGRCPYFIVAEVEQGKLKSFRAIANPGAGAFGGAGITAAQLVANEGVSVVLTGNIGPRAYQVLSQAGVKLVLGVAGMKVRDAIEAYLKGELKETQAPPMGFGPGFGAGMGMGGRYGFRGGRGQT